MLPSKKKRLNICSDCKRARSPAIQAASLGHTNCLVTAYRELGVFNERDDYGATPIHFAARNGKLDCLDWLVTRSGVSPNAVTVNGNTAAHDAAATGHVDCLKYLLENTKCTLSDTTSEGATVLHIASRFGKTEVVQWLVENVGSLPGDKGTNNVTPVHLCAAKNHLECLKWLTGHPQYVPNEKTIHGATPVYFAAQEGSLECLRWLLEKARGHAYQTAIDGMAPIHAAAQAGHKLCLEYLIMEANLSVRCRADDGATPAHFAAASGQVECLEWILDNGGSIMDRDNLGGTPVHDAAEQGQVDALSCLVERGVDISAKDNDGLKPVDLARDNNQDEAFRLLFRVMKSSILTSMTPDHSLSRAKGQTSALIQEPGLAHLLDSNDTAPPIPSFPLSAEAQKAAPAPRTEGSVDITPAASVRRKRHPSSKKDSGHSETPSHVTRPPLDMRVFQMDSSSPEDINTEILRKMQGLVTEEKPPAAVGVSSSPVRVSSPVSPKLNDADGGKKGFFFKFFTGKNGSKEASRNRKMAVRKSESAAAISLSKTEAAPASPPGLAVTGVKVSPPDAAKHTKVSSPSGRKQAPVRPACARSPGERKTKSKPTSPVGRKTASPLPPTSPAKKEMVAGKAKKHPPKLPKSPARVAPQPPAPKAPLSPSDHSMKKRAVSSPPTARVQSPSRSPTSKQLQVRRPASTDVSSKVRRPVSSDRSKAKRPVSTDGSKIRRPVSTDMSKVRRPVSSGAVKPKRPSSAGGVTRGPPMARKPAAKEVLPPQQVSPATKVSASVERRTAKKAPAPVEGRPVSPTAKKVLKKKKAKKASAKASSKSPTPPTQQVKAARAGKKELQLVKDKEKSLSGQEQTQDHDVAIVKEKDPAVNVFAGDLVVDATLLNEESAEEAPLPSSVTSVGTPVGKEEEEEEEGKEEEGRKENEKEEERTEEKRIEEDGMEEVCKAIETTAQDMVEAILKKAMDNLEEDTTESTPMPLPEATLSVLKPIPPSSPPHPPPPPPPPPVVEESEPDPKVVLREKKESKPELREKAIITKAPDRKSVETPDESFTVNFVTETPNAKHSYPTTHHDLIADDLSSPGSSDDEEDPKRESFTAPGYDRLNKKNFAEFGDDVRDLESQMKATEKEWGGDRQSLNESIRSRDSLRAGQEVIELEGTLSKSTEDSKELEKEQPRPLSGKINLFEKNASVLKMAMRGLPNRPSSQTSPDPKKEDNKPTVQGGKLSDRLKMFGGKASVAKGLPTKKPERKEGEVVTKEVVSEPEKAGASNSAPAQCGSKLEPGKAACVDMAQDGVAQDSDDTSSTPPQQKSSPKRHSSSYVSISAFETIEEESSGVDSVESLDKVSPLPKIEPSLSRRQSAELLRLDGFIKTDTPPALIQAGIALRRGSGSSPSHSPLLSARTAGILRSEPVASPVRSRITSAPSVSSQGSEAMAMFMNSANLPHLNSLQDNFKEKERKRVTKVMNGLLSLPRWTGASVQLKFLGLKSDDRPKLQIWKQHGIILSSLKSIKDVEYGPKDVYIFLHVRPHGPLLYHVYVWVGIKVHGSALEEAFKHAQNLVHCLPGRPVLHKEFYGYETFDFHQMLGSGAKYLKTHHMTVPNYLNFEIGECILIEYSHSSESFERVAMSNLNYEYLSKCKNPVLLNAPTSIYLWVPESYWAEQLKGQQHLALVITELFISRCSHPKWTPVMVVTQNAEDWLFCNLFPDWAWTDLTLSPKASKLRLPLLRTPAITYPATGKLKSWIMEEETLVKVGASKLGNFYTNKVHLVYYIYQKQSSLQTWTDGTLFVWIGAKVKTSREAILQEVEKQMPTMGLVSKIPLMTVPEGKEPNQLLHLFKGKFVIHATHTSLKACRLYKLAGSGAMTMKATEVSAKSSSLHSSHSFFLLVEGSMSYVWAGQFSEKTLRRGALVIARMLTESNEVHKLTEGLEVPDFWLTLGGQAKHDHFSPSYNMPYVLPMLFSVNAIKNTPSFLQCPSMKKEDLLSSACYFLAYKDQFFLRLGTGWKEEFSPYKIAEEYVLQYYGFKTEADFVLTVVNEDNEGEIFWKWFKLQDSTALQESASVASMEGGHNSMELEGGQNNMKVEDIEEVEFGTCAVNDEADDTCPMTEFDEEIPLDSVADGEENLEHGEGLFERAGEAAEILTDMISGLEDILKGSTEAAVTSVQTETVGPSAPTSTEEIGKSMAIDKPPAKKILLTRKSVDQGPKISIKVKIVEIGKDVELQVRVSSTVISVIFKVAEAGDLRLKDNHALYEASESLQIERALEDHEVIGSVLGQWPAKNKPVLLLKPFPTKNDLWTKRTPIPKAAVTSFTKYGIVPIVSGNLHHCKKGGSKLKWRQENFVMQESGIFSVDERSDKKTLSCGLDHLLYTPSSMTRKGLATPTPHCFIMKHPTSWKDKDMKLYCTQDASSFPKWIHIVRLLKHGIQLKGNYLATKKKLEKVKEKALLEEAVTTTSST